MQQASAEADLDKRYALLRKAESTMLADQPIIPIYQYVNLHVYDPAVVENLHPNAWNYRDLSKVRVTKKK